MPFPGRLKWEFGGHVNCKTVGICTPDSVLSNYTRVKGAFSKSYRDAVVNFRIQKRTDKTGEGNAALIIMMVALILVIITYLIEFVYTPCKKQQEETKAADIKGKDCPEIKLEDLPASLRQSAISENTQSPSRLF